MSADDDAPRVEHETHVPPAHLATRGLTRRLVVGTVLGVLVFAGLSVYADLAALGANLGAFRWSAFGWALVLATGNYALRFVRWQYYLGRIGVRVAHGPSFLIFVAGFIMSITPGKVGEVFKSLLLYEHDGTSIAKTAPVVVAERVTDLAALVLLTAVGSLAFARGLPLALAGAAATVAILVGASWRPVGEALLGLAARLPILGRLTPRLREAYEALYTLNRPVPLAVATSVSVVSWGLEGISLGVLLRGFPDAALSWTAATFAYSASTIAGALAMMPGGLGVTEIGMTQLLELLGGGRISPATATAATMLCRVATLWWAVVLGAVALAILRLQRRLQPGASRPAPNP
ncbi:MAG: YbhN family protein [Sandaracinaceae bacterium]